MDEHSTGSDEDVKLDEQLDEDLESQIKQTEKELENVETPDELNAESGIDSKRMEEFLNAIKKMPRDKAIQLLANMGKGMKDSDHNFKEVSDKEVLSVKERYRMKLNSLKTRRQSKEIIKKLTEKEKIKKKEDEKKKGKDEEAKLNTIHVGKPTKSQKRRQKLKAKKQRDAHADESAATCENPAE